MRVLITLAAGALAVIMLAASVTAETATVSRQAAPEGLTCRPAAGDVLAHYVWDTYPDNNGYDVRYVGILEGDAEIEQHQISVPLEEFTLRADMKEGYVQVRALITDNVASEWTDPSEGQVVDGNCLPVE